MGHTHTDTHRHTQTHTHTHTLSLSPVCLFVCACREPLSDDMDVKNFMAMENPTYGLQLEDDDHTAEYSQA